MRPIEDPDHPGFVLVDLLPRDAALALGERCLLRHVDVSFRAPLPGGGGQQLHADAVKLTSRDGPFTTVTSIVALCDFTEANGATGLLPGSHRRPDLQRRAGTLLDHPDEHVVTCPAGTAIVFSGHLLHRGRPNRSPSPRPALQIVWRTPPGSDGI